MRLAFVFLLFLLGVSSLDAQINASVDKKRIINTYDINDGLLHMQINSLKITSDGKLWIGTRNGLAQFNGEEFTNFTSQKNAPSYVIDIAELEDHKIALLQPEGVNIFDGSKFEFFPFPNNRSILRGLIKHDWRGRLWISDFNKNEVLCFENNKYSNLEDQYSFFKGKSINSIFINNNIQAIFILDRSAQVFKINNDDIALIKKLGSKRQFKYSKLNFNSDQNKIQLLERIADDKIQTLILNLENQIIDTVVIADAQTKKIKILDKAKKYDFIKQGIDDHLINYKYGVPDTILKNIVANYNYFHCLETSENGYFIGTDKGLVIAKNSPFEIYSGEDHPYTWTINETADQKIVAGLFGSGLKILDTNEKLVAYDVKMPPLNERNKIISDHIYMGSFKDEQQNVYFPYSFGLLKLTQNDLYHFAPLPYKNSSDPSLFGIYDKANKTIIRSKCPGIEIFSEDGESITKVKSPFYKESCTLTVLKSDDNKIWFGGRAGVSCYDLVSKSLKNYKGQTDTLSLSVVVSSLKDSQGNLWFGGKNGLVKYDAEMDQFIDIKGLNKFVISGLIETKNQILFAATVEGLLMIDLKKLLEEDILISRLFNYGDGFDGIQLGQNGFYEDSKGYIWITSSTNLIKFNPDDLNFQKENLQASVTSINDKLFANSSDSIIEIEDGLTTVNLKYGISNFNDSGLKEFRYRINEKAWNIWTENKTTIINSLPSGINTFDLQARYKGTNVEPTEYDRTQFKISIPFYKENWFSFILTVLLLGSFFFLIYQMRTNIYQARINELLEQDNEKLIFQNEELTRINARIGKAVVTSQTSKKLEIKSSGKIFKIPFEEVECILAEDNGSRIYFGEKSLWTSKTLKIIKEQLATDTFIQIHRSNIININNTVWVSQSSVKTKNGQVLNIGRKYKKEIMGILSRN